MEFLLIHLIHLLVQSQRNKAERSGSVLKKLACENCHTEYVYLMKRTARVTGHASPAESEHNAEKCLRLLLAYDFDIVPCPVCGWYQANMVSQLKRRASRALNLTALVTALLTPFFLCPAFAFLIDATNPNGPNAPLGAAAFVMALPGICLLGALALWIAARIRSARCDPNAADQDERIELGRSLARPWKEVAHILE